MNKIKYLLAMPLLMLASCSQEEVQIVEEEAVTVSFSASLPQRMATRAGEDAPVNQVVCAVFNEDGSTEYPNLRQTIQVEAEKNIMYSPQLITGKTYKIAFWASNEGQYNVEDMTAIVRAATPTSTEGAQFDAFTAFETVMVSDETNKTVVLNRPLAKLNIGVTEADWEAVQSLGQTPKTVKIKATVPTEFNACTGAASNETEQVYTIPVNGNTFSKNSTTYYNLAECFVMMEKDEKDLADIRISIYADEDCQEPIKENIQIPNLPLQNNYKTNLLGGLMTATVTYTVTFNKEFAEDKQENIK